MYYFGNGEMYIRIKLQLFNEDKLDLKKKTLLLTDALIYLESVYHNGEYSYYLQVFLEQHTYNVWEEEKNK